MADAYHYAGDLPETASSGLREAPVACGSNVKRNKQPAKKYRPRYLFSTNILTEVTCKRCKEFLIKGGKLERTK